MPSKPFQSRLNPYRDEIADMRKPWPPVSYKEIALILKERHGLEISPHAIWSFVKTRALGNPRRFYQLPENK
jgi:hypothetical protein